MSGTAKTAWDRRVPWMFVAFFAAIAIIDAGLVTIAVRTGTGTVTEQAYEKGLDYNRTLEAAARQAAEGWQGAIGLEGRRLSFALKDRDGGPVRGAAVRAEIVRPVAAGRDFGLPLREAAPGVYEAETDFPLPGQWNVRIYASWQDRHYQQARTFTVP